MRIDAIRNVSVFNYNKCKLKQANQKKIAQKCNNVNFEGKNGAILGAWMGTACSIGLTVVTGGILTPILFAATGAVIGSTVEDNNNPPFGGGGGAGSSSSSDKVEY